MLDILFLAVVAGLLPAFLLAAWIVPGGAPAAEEGGEPPAFVTSGGIKTMLLSGAGLVIWSAYIFVRSYWHALPDAAKFLGFAALGLTSFGAGTALARRGWVPRTARTLAGLGLVMMPFIAYSARVWLWPDALSSFMAWSLGLAAMAVLAAATSRTSPTWEVGYLAAAGASGALGLAALDKTADPQKTLALSALGVLGAAFLSAAWKPREDAARGAFHAALTGWLGVAGTIAGYGLFWSSENQLFTAMALGLLGASAAWAGHDRHPAFSIPAGAAFAAAGAVLLRHFDLPVYQYGYVFGPMGLVALWRAWTWERAGKTALARPVFWFGHLCLAASILAVTPTFLKPGEASLPALTGVLSLVGVAYALGGAFHKSPLYAYASGVTFLVLTGALTRQTGAMFTDGVFLFTLAAGAILGVGFIGGADDESFGRPLTVLGMGTLTVALALLGGRWGQDLFLTGTAALTMSAEQSNAGLWTGGLSLAAYGFMAFTKRKGAFLYPALYSATWVYVCVLSKAGGQMTLLHVAGIVAGAMVLCTVLEAVAQEELARGARLWGEVAFIFIGWAAVASAAPQALAAVLVSAAAFLPGLRRGRSDTSFALLAAVYLSHYLLFRRGHPFLSPSDWALFALHGVAANCGVVFLRTVLTRLRPDMNVTPFRLAAFLYAVVGLGLSLQDWGIAWQVFLAYGVMATAVSFLHYEGRHWGIGAFLIAAAAEIFLFQHGARQMEAFTWPVGFLLVLSGAGRRGAPEARDFLYGLGLIVLFGPSSAKALQEHWGTHGQLLAAAALVSVLAGVLLRSRVLSLGGGLMLLADAAYQSRAWIWDMPRWAYMGLAGLALIVLAGVFEFRRDGLVRAKESLAGAWGRWE